MKHAFSTQVYYSDTDAYGVAWHGSYLRWLEMGRVMLCEDAGYKLSQLEQNDIILPVAELNIKYKNSAKLEDKIEIKTNIIDKGRFYITFHQTINDVESKKMYIEATVKVVAVNKSGKLYRSLPEQVEKICSAKAD